MQSLARPTMGLGTTLLALSAVWASSVWSKPPATPPPGQHGTDALPTVAASRTELATHDATTWLDGLVPYMLERNDVAGAVVVVVKDGEIIVQKGYGLADVAARTPVDPTHTLFRPGSVTKLVTWTAVMQLVGQGKLDLDADIHAYLDFSVPENPSPGDKPITLRHVLTHTTGFEDSIKGLMRSGFENTESLEEALKSTIPRRMYAPGSVPAYSNYATGLAGYIVARVSGQSFDDYVEQHIFAPLGMTTASMRQPLPERLRPMLAQGYALASDPPKPYQMLVPAPSGSLAASGVDMARFMIAHLENAAGRPSPILDAATAALMYQPQENHTPPLNTMALGFYENSINRERVIGHGGDTRWFHSNLYLFLDRGVGVFVSLNSAGKDAAHDAIHRELFRGFTERYFPPVDEAVAATVDAATASAHASLLASRAYRLSRRSDAGPARLMGTLSQIRVLAHSDGTVSVPILLGVNGEPMRWREISPFVWKRVDGPERLAAVVEDGRVIHWSVDPYAPFAVFEPVPSSRSAIWLMPTLQLSLGWLFMALLAWPVLAWVQRRHGYQRGWDTLRVAIHRISRLAVALVLTIWLGAVILVAYGVADYSHFAPALDRWIYALGAMAIVACTLGSAAIGLNAWKAWTSRGSWPARIANTLILISALIACYAMWQSGLMGFPSHY